MLDLLFGPRKQALQGDGLWNDGWIAPGRIRTQAGSVVDEDLALTYSAVWCATRLLAETVACLDLVVHRHLPNNRGSERADDLPIYSLLLWTPNPEMTAMAFREGRVVHQVLWGNAFAEIERNRLGDVAALWPIHPSRVRPVRPEQEIPGYDYLVRNNDGSSVPMKASEVLHLPGVLQEDGHWGKGVVPYGRESIGFGLATERHGAKLFGSGGLPQGIVHAPGLKDRQQRDNFRREWKEIHASPDSGEIAILPLDGKFTPITVDNDSTQFLQTRKHNIQEIARWFRIPSHLIGELMGPAGYNSIEMLGQEFLNYSLLPWLTRWEQEIAHKLLAPEDRAEISIKFDLRGLLRADLTTRMNAYRTAIDTGIMTVNEARILEGMNSIGPAGDVNYRPVNTTSAEDMTAGKPEAANPPPPEAGELKLAAQVPFLAYDPDQPRDASGQWTDNGDTEIDRQRDQEDTETARRRDQEDRQQSRQRDQEDRQIEKSRKKEDADQAKEYRRAESQLQRRHDQEEKAMQDRLEKAEVQHERDTAHLSQEEKAKADKDFSDRVAKEYSERRAQEDKDWKEHWAEQDKKDAEYTERKEKERTAENEAIQKRRDAEDARDNARRNAEDDAVQARRDAEDQGIEDRRRGSSARHQAKLAEAMGPVMGLLAPFAPQQKPVAATRAILLDVLKRFTFKECQAATRAARGKDWDQWCHEFYPKHQAKLAEALGSVMGLLTDFAPHQTAMGLAAELVAESRAYFEEGYNTLTPDGFTENIQSWQQDQPGRTCDRILASYDPDQPRDASGQWTADGDGAAEEEHYARQDRERAAKREEIVKREGEAKDKENDRYEREKQEASDRHAAREKTPESRLAHARENKEIDARHQANMERVGDESRAHDQETKRIEEERDKATIQKTAARDREDQERNARHEKENDAHTEHWQDNVMGKLSDRHGKEQDQFEKARDRKFKQADRERAQIVKQGRAASSDHAERKKPEREAEDLAREKKRAEIVDREKSARHDEVRRQHEERRNLSKQQEKELHEGVAAGKDKEWEKATFSKHAREDEALAVQHADRLHDLGKERREHDAETKRLPKVRKQEDHAAAEPHREALKQHDEATDRQADKWNRDEEAMQERHKQEFDAKDKEWERSWDALQQKHKDETATVKRQRRAEDRAKRQHQP